jgi:hypothetical protein
MVVKNGYIVHQHLNDVVFHIPPLCLCSSRYFEITVADRYCQEFGEFILYFELDGHNHPFVPNLRDLTAAFY